MLLEIANQVYGYKYLPNESPVNKFNRDPWNVTYVLWNGLCLHKLIKVNRLVLIEIVLFFKADYLV